MGEEMSKSDDERPYLENMSLRHKRKMIISSIILAVLLSQFVLSAVQRSRYHYDDEGYEDYSCVEMSRDCERWFEKFGIRVYQMTGERKTGEMMEEGGYETDGHRWIILDFGWFQIPYESTALCPWDMSWNGYKKVSISSGYVVDGVHFDNETDLIWMDYN
ncbi:unnamed protein product [marine sediment metagenome]|uniref:Uncharacterized protein n=1 Tax=marine sediment metagenome TaxID=412755 RepID=X1B9B4_9ZZZZ